MDDGHEHRHVPAGGHVGAEHARRLASLDQWEQAAEHGLVSPVQFFGVEVLVVMATNAW
jgi:hypothetical protein